MSNPSGSGGSYIPPNIPNDMCRDLWGCEQHKNSCPYFAQYLGGTPSAPSEGVTDERQQQAQLRDLRQAAICVEKMQSVKMGADSTPYQRAAFLMSTLWDPKQTLTISFMPLPANYPGKQPQWDGSIKVPQATHQPTPSGSAGANCSTDSECTSGNMVCGGGKCVEDIMPTWYTRDQVLTNTKPGTTLSASDEELERKVRSMDPVDAIQFVVMERLQPLIGVQLQWVEADGDIRIRLNNQGGAWSYVGNQSKQIAKSQETMNFGWLDVATIIHEFCHALGMIHEHQNPYGQGIDWNLKKIYSWASVTQGWDLYTTCQNITKKYSIDQVNGSNFDPQSIMLYSYPADMTNNKIGTYRNIVLSDSDKEWLSAIYPKMGARRIPERLGQSAGGNGGDTSSSKGMSTAMIVIIAFVVVALLAGGGYYVYQQRQKKQQSESSLSPQINE